MMKADVVQNNHVDLFGIIALATKNYIPNQNK